MTDLLVAAVPGLAVLGALLAQLPRTPAGADRVSAAGAIATAAAALAVAARALARPGDPLSGSWYVVDAGGGVFLAVIAAVGLMSVLLSPSYLRGAGRSFFRAHRARAWYHLGLLLFWAALLAVPLVDNLGVAWLLVEATTGTSALLVAYSGRRSALEAGWKYLVLTTLGLTVALLGILVLYAGLARGGAGGLAALDWTAIASGAPGLPREGALLAFLLLLVGLAAKIGWAPVHNWLPDAHSEAPPPVSALLSAALLPSVMFVAWRVVLTLGPALRDGAATGLFLAFGLASLAVAVPFLWRPLAWKRLLAYSSLEHMGVLALGIGFAHPLATAGVVLHVAGHALAKALGFYAAIPLLRHDPRAGKQPPSGVAAGSRSTAGALGLSLGSLAGMPPSPLFFSEVLILLGGIAAGEVAVAAVAGGLLALGFLGLAHALIESLAGEPRVRRWSGPRSARRMVALTGAVAVGLAALSAAAAALPGSAIVDGLMRGVGG